jgi:Ca2+-dependent lipid-binding protein
MKTNIFWRTATIEDCVAPEWNEEMVTDKRKTVIVEVWDANHSSDDDLYGSFKVAVRKLLHAKEKRMECEVMKEGVGQGLFITLSCKKLATQAFPVKIDEPSTVEINLIRGLGFKTERRRMIREYVLLF